MYGYAAILCKLGADLPNKKLTTCKQREKMTEMEIFSRCLII